MVRVPRVLTALATASLIAATAGCGRDASAPRDEQALTASLRSEPSRYNRYVEATAAGDVVSLLVDGRLLRVNRATDTIEPALAESWTSSPDGLVHTLALRRGIRFSDGAPFTSADVLFSARVL